MIKRKENVESHMSGNLLAKWIIGKAEKSEAYRAGTLTGMKHPKPDREMIKAAGGLPELIDRLMSWRKADISGQKKAIWARI